MSERVSRCCRFAAFQVCILSLMAALCCGSATVGRAQGTDAQDYTRITQVPRAEIDAWLKQEVAASRGAWDADRYHFYIGFSTGHFGQDPVHAIAMRRLAFSLVNNSLAVGDRITPIAWEMTTWDVGPTIALTESPASRAEFVDRVPYAPHSGSRGGHDIERVLYETITKAIPPEERQSAIVLLLTNSNASQSPTGERASLFGADNPQLADALRQGGFRLPPVRKEFRLQAGTQPVTVALTALFPQKLASLPGASPGPRYPAFALETWQPTTDRPGANEKLPNRPRTGPPPPPPPPSPARGIPGWVWGVVVLAVVVLALFLWRLAKPGTPGPRPPVIPKEPTSTPISGSLTVTVGPDAQTFEQLTSASRWILLRDGGKAALVAAPLAPDSAAADGEAKAAPPGTPLAKLTFDAKRVLKVEAEGGAQFVEINGTAANESSSHTLHIDPGKRALCRVLPPDTATKTRLEIVYTMQKGS